jgi:hypothetical protein
MIQLKVKGFEHYLISKDGKVFNTRGANGLLRNGPRELKSHPNKNTGYHSVVLRAKNLKPISKNVHRLVAEHYIPNPDNKPQVNHKDGNKNNNSISNLEWMTHSENQRHAWEIGLLNNETYNKKTIAIRNDKVLLNQGLEHYKLYQNIGYVMNMWSVKSYHIVKKLLVENGVDMNTHRKYHTGSLTPLAEQEIKNYFTDVFTKKIKPFKNSSDYISYIKNKYGINFSLSGYYRIRSFVKKELFSN